MADMSGKAVRSAGNTGPRDFSAAIGAHFDQPGAPESPAVAPRAGVMKVGATSDDGSRGCVIEFDAGDQNPMEIYEAFERMLAAWPAARIPVKTAAKDRHPGGGK